MEAPQYLLVKARADQIPLLDNSVGLVIATPPVFGIRHRPKRDYCTSNVVEYDRSIKDFLHEAARIVQPGRHVLIFECKTEPRGTRGARIIIFHVLQKQKSNGHWRCRQLRSDIFRSHYIEVKGFPWWAIAQRLYRELIERYSRHGEVIAHVFSGSGNGAIAALHSGRRAILIDMHYHRQIGRRLRNAFGHCQCRLACVSD